MMLPNVYLQYSDWNCSFFISYHKNTVVFVVLRERTMQNISYAWRNFMKASWWRHLLNLISAGLVLTAMHGELTWAKFLWLTPVSWIATWKAVESHHDPASYVLHYPTVYISKANVYDLMKTTGTYLDIPCLLLWDELTKETFAA